MRKRALILSLLALSLASIGAVALLFVLSNRTIAYHNNFTRRFPDYTQEYKVYDLGLDSYYFAGIAYDTICLGNYTSPLTLSKIDMGLTRMSQSRITIDGPDMPWQSPQIRVYNESLYLIDGSVPAIFKGSTTALRAANVPLKVPQFFKYQFTDPTSLIYVFIDPETGYSTFGKYTLGAVTPGIANSKLLERQVDGLFDVEGQLHYDYNSGRLVYVYRYRNQYLSFRADLSGLEKGHTIDTVTKAQVRPARLKGQNAIKLSEPALTVNRESAVYDNLLFANSALPGQYEPLELWDKASIIDVYDLNDNSYRASFYVYHRGGKKLRSFFIRDRSFFGFIGTELVEYKLGRNLTR